MPILKLRADFGTVAICVGIDWRGLRSGKDTGSGSKVNRLIGEFLGQDLPAVDFAHGDLTRGEQCPEQHRCGLGGRQHRLGLDPALELFMEPFDRVAGAHALPLAARQPGEGEETITSLLEAVGYRLAFEPPFAEEDPVPFLDLDGGSGVDHVVVVGRDLVVQPPGRVGQQVAVLMDGAALGRHIAPERGQRLLQPRPAVDNQDLRLAQPALDEVVKDGAPSLAGLAPHVLDGQQHLLAVLAYAEHDQEHDRGGPPVEPDPHHSAVED